MHDDCCVYNLAFMAGYNTWEKEWYTKDIFNRSESIAACQDWLDTEYPGAKVMSRSYSEPCFLYFASIDQKTHFMLKWG